METIEEAQARYTAAAHAMQTGVAMAMHLDPKSTEPKHLRVGVNSALSNLGAIAELLISKGVFTREEYYTAVADAMEREQATYERQIRESFGNPNVTLR